MAPLISLSEVSKSFGTRSLFQDISLVISEGDRTALIGPNGAGKSTLFKIIAQLQEPDEGKLSLKKGLLLGYVPQIESLGEDLTVEQVLLSALGKHILDRSARLSKYLGKCGFNAPQTKIGELSGGWRKRVAIASALIQEPELLLLDEPTNHLDIDSILWLEEVIEDCSAAVVFISHDRYFIERIATRVIELDRVYQKGYLSSDGSYSDFLETRESYLAERESYKESLQNKVRREVAWLRQGVKARRTKAKGRIQQAGRLIDELGSINLERKKADLTFSSSGRRTKELVHLERVSKSLGERVLINNLTLTLLPGVRVGISGSNGSGKTTLLKTLLGMLAPDKGSIRTAPNLRIAYFDQKRDELDPDLSLKKALCPDGDSVVFNDQELHIVTWARKFLFSSDHLALPVRALSGGERARVLLARLMLQPADLLVLDEPTNDLDIPTLEVLEETLCEFAGAVVLVTHDRHMLDRLCTKVIGLDGAGSCASYADYTQWELTRQTIAPKPLQNTQSPLQNRSTSNSELSLNEVELEIARVEAEISELQAQIANPELSQDQEWLISQCEILLHKEEELDGLYQSWEELGQDH